MIAFSRLHIKIQGINKVFTRLEALSGYFCAFSESWITNYLYMRLSAKFKSSLLLFAACAFVSMASAQIQWGLKGGLNETEILTSSNQYIYVNGVTQGIKNFPKAAIHAGVLLYIPISKKFSFQPEAVFSMQGADGKPTLGYLVSATETYKFNFVNIPLLLKYSLANGIFFETGPQLGYLASVDIDENVVGSYYTSHYHPKSQYKSTDISWCLGTGYLSTFNVGFDIRYSLGLTDFSNVTPDGMHSAPVQNGSIKNSVLQFGVFYLFGKPRVAVKKEE